MAPRGLKALLKKTQPAKLAGTGKFRGFVPLRADGSTGTKLRGLTKRLQARLWSDGELPAHAKRADPRAGGYWGGCKGGQLRGKRVDAQLTRLIVAGPGGAEGATPRLTGSPRWCCRAWRRAASSRSVSQRCAILPSAYRLGTGRRHCGLLQEAQPPRHRRGRVWLRQWAQSGGRAQRPRVHHAGTPLACLRLQPAPPPAATLRHPPPLCRREGDAGAHRRARR